MSKIVLPQIKLRHYQKKPFEDLFIHGYNRIIRILHRRAGKDKEAMQLLQMAALAKPGLYFYLLPKINQARTVIWEGRGLDGVKLIDCIPPKLVTKDHQTTMRRYLSNGSIIQVTGADNYETLVGSNPLGIVFSEYSLCHPRAWHFMRPILAQNGGWALFNYTPRGMNHGWELYQDNLENPQWSVSKLSVNDTSYDDGTPIITSEVIEEERRAGMPESLVQQEFYCSFEASVVGTYFAEEVEILRNEGKICDFDIDPKVPVHTSWDLGVDDKNVIILWQCVGPEYRAFYVIEDSRKSVAHYALELKRIQKLFGFNSYGIHFGPHDIQVQEWGTGKTRYMQAREVGVNFRQVPKVLDKEGIQCIRYLFPRLRIHRRNCGLLIRALSEFKSEYDTEKKAFGKTPVHDWTSHFVKAVQYFSVGFMDAFNRSALNQQRAYGRDSI